jgi:long-subunit fatty acid transport protein
MNRANTGYIGEYDINLSGNINNRVYLGLTVGIHDVHYKGVSEYTEHLLGYDDDGNVVPVGPVTIDDERTITGTGVDVKAGIIFRPVESSPFRIGLSIATPTFYKLKSQSATRLLNGTPYQGPYPGYVAKSSYEFKLNTPWKFGLSLGHTIDQFVALGAGIEYADYGSIDSREITDEYYDYYYDTTTTESESDVEMNRHTSETLKGVVQLKLGAEVKVDKNFAVRFGYNYASPMYKESGSKDFDIDSYGTNCASATDFTNWKATNRLTCGIGYRYNNFNVDLAYQYSVRKGTFSPFQAAWGDYYDGDVDNPEQIDITPTTVEVSNKRHQLLLTLGYTF